MTFIIRYFPPLHHLILFLWACKAYAARHDCSWNSVELSMELWDLFLKHFRILSNKQIWEHRISSSLTIETHKTKRKKAHFKYIFQQDCLILKLKHSLRTWILETKVLSESKYCGKIYISLPHFPKV